MGSSLPASELELEGTGNPIRYFNEGRDQSGPFSWLLDYVRISNAHLLEIAASFPIP
jgi:hypothetical protein